MIRINQDEVHNEKKSDKNDEEKRKEYREELKTSFGLKRYKIQEVIKPGQVILIQVIKEERGRKELDNFYFFSRKIYGFNAQYSKRWWYIKKNI